MWDESTEPTQPNASWDSFDMVRKAAVEIAFQEELKDTREIGAKNRGPIVDIYLRNANALGHNALETDEGGGWCGMFIYYCYSQAASRFGKTLPFHGGNLQSGRKIVRWSERHWDKIVYTTPLLPGDIFVRNDNHVGMITGMINSELYETIEGNQGGHIKMEKGIKKKTATFSNMKVLIRI